MSAHMDSIRLDGAEPVDIRIRRSARARRLSLRVSSLDGRVTMTVPARLPLSEAIAFAGERRDWIHRARSGANTHIRIRPDVPIPVEGTDLLVECAPIRKAERADGRLLLPARAPAAGARAFLQLLARDRLAAACDGHAASLGVSYSVLALRDTRSRWGSCSREGRLMFSWRLAMAPRQVLDYVAAHEVSHLVRMDHSPAFWRVVSQLDPDWQAARRWLRRNGAGLHAYLFED